MTTTDTLEIVPYDDTLAGAFYDINADWIEAMFVLEPHDIDVLSDPRTHIIERGGAVLFVRHPAHGIVGTCALMPSDGNAVELTKMGVVEAARGQKAGEFLLEAAIVQARTMSADPLYLLTHHSCKAAIHLYEKLGFSHDADIMAQYGAVYARCTVAMRYTAP